MPRSVTVTLLTASVIPETEMVEGKTEAGPLLPEAGILMAAAFVFETVDRTVRPSGTLTVIVPELDAAF